VDGVDTLRYQGAGMELARTLQQVFPEAQLQIYGQFQTASLLWHDDPEINAFTVDIATSRSEFYPYPAANPEVTASSIRQDLYRRDFTVNALAVRLTAQGSRQTTTMELLDFFGGWEDIQQRRIRVLHPNSFIEDPTRIFRAVRFATRLGFTLDPQTEAYIRHAIASGIYQNLQANRAKAPALQSRLRNELKYIFKLGNWPSALRLMDHLGALQCLHVQSSLDKAWWRQTQIALQWSQHFDPEHKHIDQWLLIVERLLLALPHLERCETASQLHLPEMTQQRFAVFASAQTQVLETLSNTPTPSRVAHCLQAYDLPLLIELGALSPVPVRRWIWRYLVQLRFVKPLLSGADLIQLGYRPGPQFKAMLEALLSATLDQAVSTQAEAIAWIQARFLP
ncbi:MAG TPA: poly(A) polymerase, partial [Stenomitos sp.]